MDDKILSTSEAAEILGVVDSRIRQLILNKEIPAVKFGRAWMIKASDLGEYQKKKTMR